MIGKGSLSVLSQCTCEGTSFFFCRVDCRQWNIIIEIKIKKPPILSFDDTINRFQQVSVKSKSISWQGISQREDGFFGFKK